MVFSGPSVRGRKTTLLATEEISPQAIAVLILINLYAHGEISDSVLQPVLISLMKLLNHEPFINKNGEIIAIPKGLDLAEQLLEATESNAAENSPGKVVVYKLMEALWNISSVEDLDKAAWNSICLVTDPTVVSAKNGNVQMFSPRSPIGNYIQKCVTTLKILHYDESYLLLESLISYREPTRELFKSMGGHINSSAQASKPFAVIESEDDKLFGALQSKLADHVDISIPLTTGAFPTENPEVLAVPKYDLQVLLEKQIEILESNGQKTPKILKQIMELMTSNDVNTYAIQNANLNSHPSYYYLKYLECLHDSDYQGSFEALHQYFDHVVSNNSKYFYHFALISRASLHQYFGEDEKALDAIEEAISVARENKDNTTLTYILSWFFNFMRNKPELWTLQKFYHNNNEAHLLDFLVKKSKSVSLALYAMSYHFEVLYIMNTGGSLNKYLESLLKATYISINDHLVSFIKSMEVASTVWMRIGNFHLGEVYSEIASEYAKKLNKLGDEVSIEIRRAYLFHLKGDSAKGLKLLEQLQDKIKQNVSLSVLLKIRTLILQVKTDINRKRLRQAEKTMESLLDEDVNEIELKAELIYAKAEVQSSVGNNSKAVSEISSFISYLESFPSQTKTNIHTIMRLNLLRCKIFGESASPERAVSLLVQQIQQAKKVGLVSVVVEGLIIFASLLNKLESYVDSYNLLHNKMSTIVALDNIEFTSFAYYELSVSCYHLTQDEESLKRLNTNEKDLFNRFLKYLNLAISGYKMSVSLDMLQKCFTLERMMAELKDAAELIAHSNNALEKLNKRIIEESNVGYIKPKT